MRTRLARTKISFAAVGLFALVAALACAGSDQAPPAGEQRGPDRPAPAVSQEAETVSDAADVIRVEVRGEPGAYTFAVTVASPDTGCEAYADWWEVLSVDGELVYRRTLDHSHVNEQPFERSGGPVDVSADQQVVVRAHMSTTGYGGLAHRGSVAGGFGSDVLATDFAAELEQAEPRPNPCAF